MRRKTSKPKAPGGRCRPPDDIRKVCGKVVTLCRQLELFTDASLAINGARFRAVNNPDRNFTPAKRKRRMEEVLYVRFVICGADYLTR